MKKVDLRKIAILKIIVEEYIKTGDIVGSKSLLKKHEIGVSSATVRNDMANLEKMGLIFQPYNSAGRLPTTRGIRVFVDYLMEYMMPQILEAQNELVERYDRERVDDAIYGLVAKLTKTTKEITFGCIPSLGANYYLGLTSYLEKNIPLIGGEAYNVIKVLENKHHFIDLLKNLEVTRKVSVFIGEENIIPELESSAMIVKRINLEWEDAYIGMLGSMKMDYAFNIAALQNIL
jgi:transcriptional regulator of heat shock response